MREPTLRYVLLEGSVERCELLGVRVLTEERLPKKTQYKAGDFVADIRLPNNYNGLPMLTVPEAYVFFDKESAECALEEGIRYTVLNDNVVQGFLHGERITEQDDIPARPKKGNTPKADITSILSLVPGENASMISVIPRGKFPVNTIILVHSKQVFATYAEAQKLLNDALAERVERYNRIRGIADLNLKYDDFEKAALRVLNQKGAQTKWQLLESISNETADASWMRATQANRELKGLGGYAPQIVTYEWLKAGIAAVMPRLTFAPHLVKFGKKGYTEKGPNRMQVQLSARGRMRASSLTNI